MRRSLHVRLRETYWLTGPFAWVVHEAIPELGTLPPPFYHSYIVRRFVHRPHALEYR